jgi:hypothetical protein
LAEEQEERAGSVIAMVNAVRSSETISSSMVILVDLSLLIFVSEIAPLLKHTGRKPQGGYPNE